VARAVPSEDAAHLAQILGAERMVQPAERLQPAVRVAEALS